MIFVFLSCCLSLTADDLFKVIQNEQLIEYTVPFTFKDVSASQCKLNSTIETITCPPNRNWSNTARLTYKITDLPMANFEFKEFTCNAITKNPKQYCYIEVIKDGKNINGDHSQAGETIKDITNYIINDTIIKIFFFTGDDEGVFKMPVIKFTGRKYDRVSFGKPILTKLQKNVYRASVEVDKLEKMFLQSLILENIFPLPSTIAVTNRKIYYSNNKLMCLPMMANASLIIGYDIYSDEFHAWEQKKEIYGHFMELAMKPRRKFTISYLIIEKPSTSWRDAMEKWHMTFSDIYDVNIGPGAWNAFGDEKIMDDDVMKRLMAKFYWGTLRQDKAHGLSSYVYNEPTLLHHEGVDCNSSFNDVIESCAEIDEVCRLIRDYAVRNYEGKLVCQRNYNGKGAQIYTVFHGECKEYIQKTLKILLNHSWKFTGIGIDSFNNYHAAYHARKLPPVEDCPYFMIDKYNNDTEFINMMSLYFPYFKELKQLITQGFMTNDVYMMPQITKYIDSSGYEFPLTYIKGDNLSPHWWTKRYTMGSRSMSYLDTSGDFSLNEAYFSYCSVLGCTPSFENSQTTPNLWKSKELQIKLMPIYDKWRSVLTEILKDSTFYANGQGKVKGFANDNWAVNCKKNGVCYASFFLLKENTEYNATIDSFSECYYAADGAKCKVEGNMIKMRTTVPLRSVIVKFGHVPVAGQIVQYAIVALTGITIISLIVIITLAIKKKNNDSNEKSELHETVA